MAVLACVMMDAGSRSLYSSVRVHSTRNWVAHGTGKRGALLDALLCLARWMARSWLSGGGAIAEAATGEAKYRSEKCWAAAERAAATAPLSACSSPLGL